MKMAIIQRLGINSVILDKVEDWEDSFLNFDTASRYLSSRLVKIYQKKQTIVKM